MAKKKKTKRRYTDVEKAAAVLSVREEMNADVHDSLWSAIKAVARRVGCNPETLRNWVNRYSDTRKESETVDTTFDDTMPDALGEMRREQERLRGELSKAQYDNNKLREENARLKKERRHWLLILRDFIEREIEPPLA